MLNTAIIVPARLASTRFPRKLLHPIRGKPLVLWVAERIAAEVPDVPLYFAVDDDELMWVLTSRGYRTVLTDPAHPSGTDRIAEANASIGADFVINVQADEPLVTAEQIRALGHQIARGCPMATLATPFPRVEDYRNSNQVKVVLSLQGEAVYFSRACIPFARDSGGDVTDAWLAAGHVYRHLGLYAYRAEFLDQFCRLPPGRLETIEKLEQLRVLENGFRIAVGLTDQPTVGVDTPADVVEFERRLDASAGRAT
ncbi:3-deoxy-manno-octulosonate cytidylyltransferase [Opitutales bacterium ASA1]|uniref:3-deoxy-manno-octulosonate cytidylyltransferase n=1 Tax=Congregicoccus parvus TaxID=3081749 RepID=UPI002B2D73ED|nr:3-deoxy-manno-octulosonate cytidylyltransferase [Opitutales bacterium ASA1]